MTEISFRLFRATALIDGVTLSRVAASVSEQIEIVTSCQMGFSLTLKPTCCRAVVLKLRRWTALAAAVGSVVLAFHSGMAAEEKKTHIALTANLGHDLDDAFAMAYLIAHPKIELDSVNMAGENPAGSLRILNRFCWLVGADPGIPQISSGGSNAGLPDPGGMFQFGLRPSRRRSAAGPDPGARPHAVTSVDLSGTVGEDEPKMSGESLEKLFSTGTPLANALRSLYELADEKATLIGFTLYGVRQRPSLAGARAVAAAAGIEFSEDRFIKLVADYQAHNEVPDRVFEPLKNVSQPVEDMNFPHRVHAIENYQTEIEQHRWLSGRAIVKDYGNRCCRGMLTRNFDGKMGDPTRLYRAVIFNPVPGPPMGPNTRLKFRYRIEGADWLQCQIFSLSKGYHRYTTIEELSQGEWQTAVVDMTKARRPDGSGGPLSAEERIDDIQFYTDPKAELFIDDIVLYDEAPGKSAEPFPKEFIFTGWFDTGKQGAGKEWPGDFEIVPHEKPRTWKAAKSVIDPETGTPWIRVGLRGLRPAGGGFRIKFDYRLRGSGPLKVIAVNSNLFRPEKTLAETITGSWATTELFFGWPLDALAGIRECPLPGEMIGEVHFRVPKGSELEIDNLLIYRRTVQ